MRITDPKTAILAFTPIGLLKEHGKSMPDKSPNQMCCVGLREKTKQECALPKNVNDSVCLSQNKNVNKSASVNFGGFFNANNIYKSNILKKSFEFASDNGALFAAGVALLTTVLLRPFAIFATPGVKKENKKYACAQSIASGAIGFGIMALISTPLAQALKKINENPQKYLKESTIKNLSDGAELLKSSKYKFSTQLFKLGADSVSAIPKALLTCALIPPIMLALFPKKQQEQQSGIYFRSAHIDNRSSQIFRGFIKR